MILHMDLDCFFVSAHRINNPKLHNIPVAVGSRSNLSIFDNNKSRYISSVNGAFTSSILTAPNKQNFKEYFVDSDNRIRGIVTTSSYEARAYGVKTAMPVSQALRLCPNLTILSPDYPLYHHLSSELKKFLEFKIPHIEQFSIDEFFGDITGYIEDEDAFEFAKNLKEEIYDRFKLPISIGVSSSKWIAKVATTKSKPSGVKIVYKEEIEEFTKDMPIEEFPGIGKGYQAKLQRYLIKKLGDIKDKKELLYSWGKSGQQLYDRVLGIDNEKVSINKEKKSIGIGRSFDPIYSRDEIKRRLTILCRHLSFLAHKNDALPYSYYIKIKYQYGIKSKDYINTNRLFNESYFKKSILEMFNKIDIHPSHAIIQVNLTISNFSKENPKTLDIFNIEEDAKNAKLSSCLHKLRGKYGIDIIKNGSEILN